MEVYGLEEKKAIEELKSLSPSEQSIDTILNLIEKQNKIIDKMGEYIAPLKNEKGVDWTRIGVKEYFTKLVEEE